jgi:hypothetical protein
MCKVKSYGCGGILKIRANVETVAESKPCILEYLPPTPKWALPIVKQEAKVIMNLNMCKSYELG